MTIFLSTADYFSAFEIVHKVEKWMYGRLVVIRRENVMFYLGIEMTVYKKTPSQTSARKVGTAYRDAERLGEGLVRVRQWRSDSFTMTKHRRMRLAIRLLQTMVVYLSTQLFNFSRSRSLKRSLKRLADQLIRQPHLIDTDNCVL